MDKLNSLITALILTFLVACQKEYSCAPSPNSALLSDTVRVKIGETVRTNDFSITLDSVNDSRCGINENCFWAGDAAVKLQVKKDNSTEIARFLLDPTKKNTVDKVTVFNRNLRLLDVLGRLHSLPQADYSVLLVVE